MKPTKSSQWGEKYAGCGAEIKPFMEFFPNGQIIAITRDLRDVYASNKQRVKNISSVAFERGDYLLILDDWKRFVTNWNNFTNRYGNRSYLVVRYEDLVMNPEKLMRKVCKFLGIEWDPRVIDGKNLVDSKGQQWTGN